MSFKEQITPLILTFNEAPNLRRTLERLTWAREIVVVDSFSTDETLVIAREFPHMRVVQRKFDDHTNQWNYGVDQIRTPWVLALDADYVLPPEFAAELNSFHPIDSLSAGYARFRFCVFGRPLRGTLYPPRAVLFRKERCRYVNDGHTQRLQINGQSFYLKSVIDHDDRKSLTHWLWAQDRYAVLEAAKLASAKAGELGWPDRIRKKIVLAPALIFFYTLFGQLLILDGWAGWYYVWQRTLAEMILSLRLTEHTLLHRSK
jgi:glycosyltransferase involved in cell wall biosynthesis